MASITELPRKVAGFTWRWILRIIIVIIAWWLISQAYTIVRPGYRGVLVRLWNVESTQDEGFHFKTPFIDKIITIDVRTKKIKEQADSSSKDLQIVTTTLALNYHLLPSKVTNIMQEIGDEYMVRDTIIAPAIQEAVKGATAKYTAEELITKRDEVSLMIKDLLTHRLEKSHVQVTDVNIENFAFSAEFNKAIESKVTAEQDALRAKNDLERIKFEAEQIKAKAEGDANAVLQKALAEAEGITEVTKALSKEYVQYEMVKRWKGDVPQINGWGNNFLLDIGGLLE